MWSWLYGIELRLFTCSYVCEISMFARHLMFISNQSDKSKNDCSYRISKFEHGSYYGWQYLQSGDRLRNDRVYGILNLYTACSASVPCKDNFFISCTHDKTHKKREPVWTKYSKEKPVWNKWQSRNVQPCGLEHIIRCYLQRTKLVTLCAPMPQHKQFTGNLVQLYVLMNSNGFVFQRNSKIHTDFIAIVFLIEIVRTGSNVQAAMT